MGYHRPLPGNLSSGIIAVTDLGGVGQTHYRGTGPTGSNELALAGSGTPGSHPGATGNRSRNFSGCLRKRRLLCSLSESRRLCHRPRR